MRIFRYPGAIMPLIRFTFMNKLTFKAEKEVIDYYMFRLSKLLGETTRLHALQNGMVLDYFSNIQDFYVRAGNETVAYFSLRQMPGCCAFVISYHVSVDCRFQGKGVGTLMNSFRLDIARFQGYTAMLCTDKLDNAPQRSILARNGFSDIYTCINKKTNNEIAISIVTL